MAKQKQTWIVKYLRIDSETRRLPLSFTCTVESNYDSDAKLPAIAGSDPIDFCLGYFNPLIPVVFDYLFLPFTS